MALNIYTVASDPTSKLSVNSAFSNALLVTSDGRSGGVIEKKLYLRNDDVLYTYETITIVPSVTGAIPVDTNGYSWKLREGTTQPTAAQWDVLAAGNTISIPNIADTSTYRPFWIRIEIPKNASVTTFSTPKLKVSANQIG